MKISNEYLIEPREGYTDKDVITVFTNFGAPSPEVLAPGFMSSPIPLELLEAVEKVAVVHIKVRRKLHKGGLRCQVT